MMFYEGNNEPGFSAPFVACESCCQETKRIPQCLASEDCI